MRQTFCDICGEEIKNTGEEGGEIIIYEEKTGDNTLQYDICDNCIEKVKSIIQTLKKEKK